MGVFHWVRINVAISRFSGAGIEKGRAAIAEELDRRGPWGTGCAAGLGCCAQVAHHAGVANARYAQSSHTQDRGARVAAGSAKDQCAGSNLDQAQARARIRLGDVAVVGEASRRGICRIESEQRAGLKPGRRDAGAHVGSVQERVDGGRIKVPATNISDTQAEDGRGTDGDVGRCPVGSHTAVEGNLLEK